MHIGAFFGLFAPSIGGQELSFEGLSRQFVKNRYAVDVRSIARAPGLARVETMDEITILRHPTDVLCKVPCFKMMKRGWLIIFESAAHVGRVVSETTYNVLLLNRLILSGLGDRPVSLASTFSEASVA